jgi:ApaG protein
MENTVSDETKPLTKPVPPAPTVPQPTSGASQGIRISDTTTRGIRVQVESAYVPDRSSPRESSYFFVYHVRISNVGSETAQLLSREWIITDAEGEVERVKGPGVVGEQPMLAPGGAFEYTSFCPLKTSVGSMHGTYQMVTPAGDKFDALISPFTLAMPNALN